MVFFACFFSLKGCLEYHGCGLTNFGSGDWKSQGEFAMGKCAF